MELKFCSECGERLLPGARFCNGCGARVERIEELDYRKKDDLGKKSFYEDDTDPENDDEYEDEADADDEYEDELYDEYGKFNENDLKIHNVDELTRTEHGSKYDTKSAEVDYRNTGETRSKESTGTYNYEPKSNGTSNNGEGFFDSIKNQFLNWFTNLDWFCKAATILIAFCALMGLISGLMDKGVSLGIAVFQVVIVVIALLLHNRVISIGHKYIFIKYILLILTVLLVAVSFKACTSEEDDSTEYVENKKHNESGNTAPTNTIAPTSTSVPTDTAAPTSTEAPSNAATQVVESTSAPETTATASSDTQDLGIAEKDCNSGTVSVPSRRVFIGNMYVDVDKSVIVEYSSENNQVLCKNENGTVIGLEYIDDSMTEKEFDNSTAEVEKVITKWLFGSNSDYTKIKSSSFSNVVGYKCIEMVFNSSNVEYHAGIINMPDTNEMYLFMLAISASRSDITIEYANFISSLGKINDENADLNLEDSDAKKVYLDMDYDSNLIFAIYDIEVYLGKTQICNISNGTHKAILTNVTPGYYDLEFRGNYSGNPIASKRIKIDEDCIISFELKAHESSIDINGYKLLSGARGSGLEVKDERGKFLSDGISELNLSGITNIKFRTQNSETVSGDKAEWYILAQNIKKGAKIDKYDTVVLTVCRISDRMKELLAGADAFEAKQICEQEGFYPTFKYELSEKEFNTSYKTEEEMHKWAVKTIVPKSNASRAVTLGLVYAGKVKMINVVDMEPEEAIEKLKENQFSNIKLEAEDGRKVTGENWIVIGQSEEAGTKIKANKKIVLTVKKTVPDPTPTPSGRQVSYHSSGYYSVAQEGNTGVYAYRAKGGEGYLYYVIDFDEGYVYYTTDLDSTCDKIKIDKGDLNDHIEFTYHDGNAVWTEALCFKYKERPDSVIWSNRVVDAKYLGYDLEDTLKIISTKTIKKY